MASPAGVAGLRLSEVALGIRTSKRRQPWMQGDDTGISQ